MQNNVVWTTAPLQQIASLLELTRKFINAPWQALCEADLISRKAESLIERVEFLQCYLQFRAKRSTDPVLMKAVKRMESGLEKVYEALEKQLNAKRPPAAGKLCCSDT